MQISREAEKMDGITKAGAMVATPENLSFFEVAGFHPPAGLSPNSILLAVDALTDAAADAAMQSMTRQIDSGTASAVRHYRMEDIPRMIGKDDFPVMFLSTPGQYVRDIARSAIDAGMHLHIFSSNVPLDQEAEIKRMARDRGTLVMGPDCGTSIIQGRGIGFANALAPGNDVGVIGSSGTGIQELTVLLDRAGLHVSWAIGTGSNDLVPEVGGITTEQAIALLRKRCPSIAVVSKKPDPALQERIVRSLGNIPSAFISLGSGSTHVAGRTLVCGVIDDAVEHLLRETGRAHGAAGETLHVPSLGTGRRLLRGYFVGGSLCYQAQAILHREGVEVFSNAPLTEAYATGGDYSGLSICMDTGAEEYVSGRPHPMIDPVARNSLLVKDSSRGDVRVLLFDVVLGYGSAADPLEGLDGLEEGPAAVASVCGTDRDRQGYSAVCRRLEQKGVRALQSASAAASFAARIMKGA